MLQQLKNLFKRLIGKKEQKPPASPIEQKTPKYPPEFEEADRNLKAAKAQLERINKSLERRLNQPVPSASSIAKSLKIARIREKNLERRRSTLGYGLRGKFKPRPAFEKRLYDLSKKPKDDD